MNVQGASIAMAMSHTKSTSAASQKPPVAEAKGEAPAEEAKESAATEASEGAKGGNINTFA